MADEVAGGSIPSELRVLLIQVRDAPEVAEHECYALRSVTGLRAEQVRAVNLALEDRVGWDDVESSDAVIIGGAGVHSAVNDDPFTDELERLVVRMVDEGVTLFGSCYGHQFIARALGGRVVHDERRAEVGAVDVFATEAAEGDPIFGRCPTRYTVLMGHQDRVDALPDGAVELAYSEKCRNQAFRLEGLPVWGTQFHAELTPERLVERLARYRHYAPDDAEFDRITRSLGSTPHASELLRRLLSGCVPGEGWRDGR